VWLKDDGGTFEVILGTQWSSCIDADDHDVSRMLLRVQAIASVAHAF
jgi:hypothetical protein